MDNSLVPVKENGFMYECRHVLILVVMDNSLVLDLIRQY